MADVKNESPELRAGIGRRENGTFLPGSSPNPGGRQKGLTTYVQQVCGGDGKKLVDMLWAIASDEHVAKRDRIRAASELLDRGWGRAVQPVSQEGLPVVPLFALPEGCMPSVTRDTREQG